MEINRGGWYYSSLDYKSLTAPPHTHTHILLPPAPPSCGTDPRSYHFLCFTEQSIAAIWSIDIMSGLATPGAQTMASYCLLVFSQAPSLLISWHDDQDYNSLSFHSLCVRCTCLSVCVLACVSTTHACTPLRPQHLRRSFFTVCFASYRDHLYTSGPHPRHQGYPWSTDLVSVRQNIIVLLVAFWPQLQANRSSWDKLFHFLYINEVDK